MSYPNYTDLVAAHFAYFLTRGHEAGGLAGSAVNAVVALIDANRER